MQPRHRSRFLNLDRLSQANDLDELCRYRAIAKGYEDMIDYSAIEGLPWATL